MPKKKVKVKKKKKTTSTGYFRQTIPKQQASGWASIGQFKQPEPPKLKPIGTYIPQFRTAWSNSARVRQEPVISKSWIKQQQDKAKSNTTMDKQNLKEALGMGTWAANITSWMDKQEKKMNTLADINKKRKGKNRRFRQHEVEEKSDEDDDQPDEEAEEAAAIVAGRRSGAGAGLEAGKGAGIGSGFPKLTDNGKYHCYCNSRIANISASVTQHKNSMKHKRYVKEVLKEDPATYDLGVNVVS